MEKLLKRTRHSSTRRIGLEEPRRVFSLRYKRCSHCPLEPPSVNERLSRFSLETRELSLAIVNVTFFFQPFAVTLWTHAIFSLAVRGWRSGPVVRLVGPLKRGPRGSHQLRFVHTSEIVRLLARAKPRAAGGSTTGPNNATANRFPPRGARSLAPRFSMGTDVPGTRGVVNQRDPLLASCQMTEDKIYRKFPPPSSSSSQPTVVLFNTSLQRVSANNLVCPNCKIIDIYPLKRH